MKIKNHITAVLLLMCILFTPALASSASAHAYDHVYNDVTVITPDSLEDVFGETEVERAAYTYEMVELSNSRAVVALEMELKIGHDYYTTIVSGTVNAYTLPSGDTLYKGPISGSITIAEETYLVTVGFIKLESTDNVTLSLTLQGNGNLVAISFGNDAIQGEVLEFLTKNATNPINNNDDLHIPNNTVDTIENIESPANIAGDASTLSLIPPPGFPVINPGPDPEHPNLGDDERYVYQNDETEFLGNSLKMGLETRVYWYRNAGSMLVTVHPKVANANSYAVEKYLFTGLFDSIVYATLDKLEVSLHLNSPYVSEDNFVESQQANIIGLGIVDSYTNGTTSIKERYFSALLLDLLNAIDVPTNTLNIMIDDMRGSVTAVRSTYDAHIDVDMSLNAQYFDEFETGMPFYFDLIRPNPENYTGNTPYKVTTIATYEAMFAAYGDSVIPAYTCIFIPCSTVHEGESITLGPI